MRVHRLSYALILVLSACGPEQRAVVAAMKNAGAPTILVTACQEYPHLTVRVYVDVDKSESNYTLSGRARARERLLIPLSAPPRGWRVDGSVSTLDTRRRVEVDVEDGNGNRLGASVYFTPDELPAAPHVVGGVPQHGEPPADVDHFVTTARRLCGST